MSKPKLNQGVTPATTLLPPCSGELSGLVRAVGESSVLLILPEHPDKCGGLKFVGTFFARMVSPVLLVFVLLSFASVDPSLTVRLADMFHIHANSSPLVEKEKKARELDREMRSEVGLARVELLKKECSELDKPLNSTSYKNCISRVVAESMAIDDAYREGHRKLWNPSIIPFARLGLLILIISIGLSFIWPLGSMHRAMVRARDKKGLELALSIEEVEKNFHEKLKSQDIQAAAEVSEQLEKARKQVLRVRRYPVWPFDAVSVSKVVIPQILALGSTLTGLLSDWLSR